MDEPVSSWACFDCFDWLALHVFLTLRLKISIRQHLRMNARPLLPPKHCHFSLRGTRECFETSPHLAYPNLPSVHEGPARTLSPSWASELAELGGTTQDHLIDQLTRKTSHVSKHKYTQTMLYLRLTVCPLMQRAPASQPA